MTVAVVSIGNSKGIRLSKTLLEKYDIQDKVELVLKEEYIILKSKPLARAGWDAAFKAMHRKGDDKLLLPDLFDDENLEEWS